jgi:hypothetical protein
VIAGITLTGVGKTVRGGDEVTFMNQAHRIAGMPWTSSQWLPWDHASYLHVIVFALQLKAFGSPEGALRITQVGFALAGVLLIAAAVADVSGPSAGRLTTWLLALEPASLLFNEILHKDPLMELASGLVVLGGTKALRSRDLRGVVLMTAGALIALGTRHYVGWFLIACAALIAFHAALRRSGGGMRSLPVIYVAAACLAVAVPAILAASTPQSLHANLVAPQQANATSTKGNGSANGNNLALEQVDFSTRSAIVANLPQRIRDILLRPYPWQAGDINQMLGVLGSVVALACFALLLRYAVVLRGRGLPVGAPLLYPLAFLTIAYALSVGNAGTGFRYRTHLVTLAIGLAVVLRSAVLQTMREEIERSSDVGPRRVGGTWHGRELPVR